VGSPEKNSGKNRLASKRRGFTDVNPRLLGTSRTVVCKEDRAAWS
jgi:hypothetical protein